MTLTPTERATIMTVAAVGDAIRGLGTVPSGHLYARLMGHMTLAQYESIIAVLLAAKLVKKSNHELTWIGPATGFGGK